MKSMVIVLLCLVMASQARVVELPERSELQDIPVAIVQEQNLEEKQPAIIATETKPVEEKLKKKVKLETPLELVPELVAETKPEKKFKKKLEQKIVKQEESAVEPQKLEPEVPKPIETLALITETNLEQKVLKSEQPETVEVQKLETSAELLEKEIVEPLKQLPAEAATQLDETANLADALTAESGLDAVNVRQVTQATPTQSTTQQNFVQQLIQNSPIGQFLNQFNPNQNQQAQAQADQPATPAPTVPGFLNPAAAITSAQQVVQSAAQSVVNSTTQAFQGIQQFANNLGTQFQNTLSGLTGQQQQQQNADVTTARPPGPIQSFVNNVFGGGNNATAAPAAPQQQGPLQGFISFLGGNRPQNANNAAAAASPVPEVAAAEKPDVDDKLEVAADSPAETDDANEVRNSAESSDDSFEESVPAEEVIVINDDAEAADNQQSAVDAQAVPLVEQQPAAVVQPVVAAV